jgi:hypothetical protein
MGDYSGTGQVSGDIFESLGRFAPEAIRAIQGTLPGLAQTELGIDQSMIDPYNELYRKGQLSSAGTEADVVEGPGKRLVSAADTYQRQLDPEYYNTRSVIGDAVGKYLGGYDPNSLSQTEVSEISRGINATTGPTTPSNMNTVKNAQTFGAAGANRWQNFGDAITKASTALPGMKSGMSGFNIASSRGANPLPSASRNAANTGFGFASGALNNIGQVANTGLSKEKSIPDQMTGAVGAY